MIKERVKKYSNFNFIEICILSEIIGGALFVIGSIFFIPKLIKIKDIGVLLFAVGCLFYLILPVTNSVKTLKKISLENKAEVYGSIAYLKGTTLFLIGSILFTSQINNNILGLICFILGSLAFIIGVFISINQIAFSQIAIFIGLGSILFLLGSLQSIWMEFNSYENSILANIIALEYIIGSIFFFLGGISNYLLYYRRKND